MYFSLAFVCNTLGLNLERLCRISCRISTILDNLFILGAIVILLDDATAVGAVVAAVAVDTVRVATVATLCLLLLLVIFVVIVAGVVLVLVVLFACVGWLKRSPGVRRGRSPPN